MLSYPIPPTTCATLALLLAAGCGGAQARPATAAAPETDDAGIRALITEHDAAWNAHDPDALTALFVDGGSVITPDGKRVEGRAALHSMFASPGPTKRTNSQTQLDAVRYLGAGLAVIDATQTLSSELPEMDGMRARLVAVARHTEGGWRLEAARPFVIGGSQ